MNKLNREEILKNLPRTIFQEIVNVSMNEIYRDDAKI